MSLADRLNRAGVIASISAAPCSEERGDSLVGFDLHDEQLRPENSNPLEWVSTVEQVTDQVAKKHAITRRLTRVMNFALLFEVFDDLADDRAIWNHKDERWI